MVCNRATMTKARVAQSCSKSWWQFTVQGKIDAGGLWMPLVSCGLLLGNASRSRFYFSNQALLLERQGAPPIMSLHQPDGSWGCLLQAPRVCLLPFLT